MIVDVSQFSNASWLMSDIVFYMLKLRIIEGWNFPLKNARFLALQCVGMPPVLSCSHHLHLHLFVCSLFSCHTDSLYLTLIISLINTLLHHYGQHVAKLCICIPFCTHMFTINTFSYCSPCGTLNTTICRILMRTTFVRINPWILFSLLRPVHKILLTKLIANIR